MHGDDEASAQPVHKQWDGELEGRVLRICGGNTLGNEEFERKKVKQPLRRSCGAQIMCEMVEARWEIMRNISAVAIRARAAAIVPKIAIPRHTGIKISCSVLGIVFLVDPILAHVAQ